MGMRTYHQGQLFDKEVVLVFSRWGKVAAATTASHLIHDFKVNEIIFTGVAGSVDENVEIGDIIVGQNLYQHDMDASPLVKRFEVPLLHRSSFSTDPDKRERLLTACNEFLMHYDDYIPQKERERFSLQKPKVVLGDIASGDQFISTKSQIQFINTHLPSAVCVEMEGAAVAQVCFEYKIPFSIFRTISDKANDNAHIDFPAFAKRIASNYALGILRNYLNV
ncbi:MAG: 5'-methylthioadenosine/adenosylhomocysteine nucleosidase [Flavobacteriaceae bacterium]|nr:5'-methylthioadenosine/adenosylhomocysteine nucleosidase [Flavobacteriaceae bacterium]